MGGHSCVKIKTKVTGYLTGYAAVDGQKIGDRIPRIRRIDGMRKHVARRAAALGLAAVMAVTMLTGCRFGFASDPDDPNEETKKSTHRHLIGYL